MLYITFICTSLLLLGYTYIIKKEEDILYLESLDIGLDKKIETK